MMICERCKKKTHCIYIIENYERICDVCYDKDERSKQKKQDNEYFMEKDRFLS
jgi:hypothetical protein